MYTNVDQQHVVMIMSGWDHIAVQHGRRVIHNNGWQLATEICGL